MEQETQELTASQRLPLASNVCRNYYGETSPRYRWLTVKPQKKPSSLVIVPDAFVEQSEFEQGIVASVGESVTFCSEGDHIWYKNPVNWEGVVMVREADIWGKK